MTNDELKRLFPRASQSTIARNQDAPGLDRVVPKIEQPEPGRTLEQNISTRQGRKKGVGQSGVRVTLIAVVRRQIDEHDNLRHGFKPLVDLIARELGLDDADPRIRWQYGQQITSGKQGTIVMIEET